MELSIVRCLPIQLEQVSTNTGPWSAAWFLKFLGLIDNFPTICTNVAIAQLIECLAGEQVDPGLVPRKGETFFA